MDKCYRNTSGTNRYRAGTEIWVEMLTDCCMEAVSPQEEPCTGIHTLSQLWRQEVYRASHVVALSNSRGEASPGLLSELWWLREDFCPSWLICFFTYLAVQRFLSFFGALHAGWTDGLNSWCLVSFWGIWIICSSYLGTFSLFCFWRMDKKIDPSWIGLKLEGLFGRIYRALFITDLS